MAPTTCSPSTTFTGPVLVADGTSGTGIVVAEAIAHAVLPLLAAESSFTTGSVVHVDGGCTAQ
ncbi:hypothetical protein [Streptomyces sp. NPDC055140]